MLRNLIYPKMNLLLVFCLLFQLMACGGGGGSSDSNTSGNGAPFEDKKVIGSLQINNDSQDPMIARIEGYELGDELLFFGEKDADGFPTKIDVIQYFNPDNDVPYIIEVDSLGRPLFISSPDNGSLVYTYEGTMMTVEHKDSDGSIYIENVSFEDLKYPNLDDYRTSSDSEGQSFETQSLETTIAVVEGKLFTSLYVDPSDKLTLLGPADVAARDIIIAGTNQEYDIMPKKRNIGEFDFEIVHRVADLEVVALKCSDNSTKYGVAYGVVAVVMAFTGIGAVAGTLTAALYFAASVFSGTAAILEGKKSLDCADLVRKTAVKEGIGVQTVNIAATHNGQTKRVTPAVEYDIFDLRDPIHINNRMKFTTSLNYEVRPKLISSSAQPPHPKIDESYMLNIKAILPQHGYVEWKVTRAKEGLNITDKWTNDGYDYIVDFSVGPIIGASNEDTDSVIIKAYYFGAEHKTVPCGEIKQTIHIKGSPSIRECPEGIWQVRYNLTNDYTGKCDPELYHMGTWEIYPDSKWEAIGADNGVQTDINSGWTFNAPAIRLNGIPTTICSEVYHQGNVVDIGSGCKEMKGNTIKKCKYKDKSWVVQDCWEATYIGD